MHLDCLFYSNTELKSTKESITSKEREINEKEATLKHETAMTNHLRDRLREKEQEVEAANSRLLLTLQEKEKELHQLQMSLHTQTEKLEVWQRSEEEKVRRTEEMLHNRQKYESAA